MGGYGSTRWKRHKKMLTTDVCFRVGIEELSPYLRSRQFGHFSYRHTPGGSVSITLTRQVIELDYAVNGTPCRQSALIEAGKLAGHWYLRCPRCFRRIRRLFLPPGSKLFACRLCHRLTWRSSQEHDDRLREFGPLFQIWRRRNGAKVTVARSHPGKLGLCHRGADLGEIASL